MVSHKKEVLCEVCRKNIAVTICIRCRRYVCSECITELWICKDCYRYKKTIESDRIRICNYIDKMATVCEEKAKQSKVCLQCVVLREMVLSLYKMLRDLINEANIEYYERVLDRLEVLRDRLKQLLIKVLVAQGGLRIYLEEEKEEYIT